MCHKERVHPLQIESQTNQAPFTAGICQPPQRKLAKTENFFEDANHRLDCAFPQAIDFFANLGGKFVGHFLFWAGIGQGEIYWIALKEPDGWEFGYSHPHVVIQENVSNHSRINTVVVCALTTKLKRAKAPGNVFLEAGEANLPRQSVVVVSQVSTVDKTQLGEYIGSLNEQRINQILAGMQFLQSMTERRETGKEE